LPRPSRESADRSGRITPELGDSEKEEDQPTNDLAPDTLSNHVIGVDDDEQARPEPGGSFRWPPSSRRIDQTE
jgi:hypothetical protein